MASTRILYCHCAYANIIPDRVKNEVLDRLIESGVRFEAVADLCELSARRDPSLRMLASGEGELRIAACFPRSVKWLFSAAEAPLPAGIEVRNMRNETAAETVAALLNRRPEPTGPETGGTVTGEVAAAPRGSGEPATSGKPAASQETGSA